MSGREEFYFKLNGSFISLAAFPGMNRIPMTRHYPFDVFEIWSRPRTISDCTIESVMSSLIFPLDFKLLDLKQKVCPHNIFQFRKIYLHFDI
jgi:hypothetical protein